MRNHGESANPVTYLMFLALGAAGFYAFHVGPLYYDNIAAKDAVGECWSTYILKGEKFAVEQLLVRLNAKSPDTSHIETNEEGVESVVPGYGVKPEQVTIDFDEKSRKLTVRLEYDRIVDFKPFKKRKVYHLVAEKTGTIQQ